MIMENTNCETLPQGQALVNASNGKDSNARGVRLEASEFERLLQRAAEILSLREKRAA